MVNHPIHKEFALKYYVTHSLKPTTNFCVPKLHPPNIVFLNRPRNMSKFVEYESYRFSLRTTICSTKAFEFSLHFILSTFDSILCHFRLKLWVFFDGAILVPKNVLVPSPLISMIILLFHCFFLPKTRQNPPKTSSRCRKLGKIGLKFWAIFPRKILSYPKS